MVILGDRLPPLAFSAIRRAGGQIVMVQRDLLGDSRRARMFRFARKHPQRFLWLDGEPYPLIAGGAANTSPIFGLTPNTGFATLTAANTATDGTGTVATLITAGTNGTLLERVRMVPLGTNVASKAYLFWNNGGAQGTAANNALILDAVLAASTASNTALIGAPLEFAFALPMKSTHTLNATLATAVAAGWKITAWGVDA